MAWEMEHPQLRTTSARHAAHRYGCPLAICALALVALTSGCRTSQQTSIPNPFLSADRVPAPASRIPAAGTAQPYYPGDAMPPLPGSQPPLQQLGALTPSDDITPIPAGESFAQSLTPTAPDATRSVAADDQGVRIPSDEGTMRFAASPAPTAIEQPAAPPAQPPTLLAQNPAAPTPTPMVFREQSPTSPVINNWPPVAAPTPQVTLTPVFDEGAVSGLFRDPRVPAQAPPLIQDTTVPYQTVQPGTVPPTTSPRIRVPGAEQRISEDIVPGAINTTSYQVGMAGGGPMQTMQIPPPGYVPPSLASPAFDQAPPMGDGFQPRGSSRDRPFRNSANPSIPTLRVTPG